MMTKRIAWTFWSIFICWFSIAHVGHAEAKLNDFFNFFNQKPHSVALNDIQVESFNYKLTNVPKSYVQMNAADFNKEASLVLYRSLPAIMMMVIAEELGESFPISLEQLTQVSKANLKSAAQESSIGEEVPMTINNIKGYTFFSDCFIENKKRSYVHWVSLHQGFAYQLIMTSMQTDQKKLHQEATTMFQKFELIDPDRRGQEKANTELIYGNYISPHSGLELDLDGEDWWQYKDHHVDQPGSETGGLMGGDTGFIISPFYTLGIAQSLTPITRALLRPWEINYPDPSLFGYKKINTAEYQGHQFQFQRQVDQTEYHYLGMILQHKEVFFLIMVWTNNKDRSLEIIAEKLLKKTKLKDLTTKDFTHWPLRIQKQTALYFNQLGLHHFEAFEFEKALKYFQHSLKFDQQELSYLTNALNTLGV